MKMDFCMSHTAARILSGNCVDNCLGNLDMHLNLVLNI